MTTDRRRPPGDLPAAGAPKPPAPPRILALEHRGVGAGVLARLEEDKR